MESKFRSVNNQRILKGLFFETSLNRDSVVYTLKDRDHTVDGKTYPSLYRLFLEADDLLEYNFAITHLDGWEHWQMLKACNWFKPYYKRWKDELETKTLSLSLYRLRAEAASSSKNAFLANRFLIERGWVPKEEKKAVGRPSKDEIKRQAENLFLASEDVNSDLARIKDLN